jgi:hypothetical protein
VEGIFYVFQGFGDVVPVCQQTVLRRNKRKSCERVKGGGGRGKEKGQEKSTEQSKEIGGAIGEESERRRQGYPSSANSQ